MYIPAVRLWTWISCWRGAEEREKSIRGFAEYQRALDEASRRALEIGDEEIVIGRWELVGWAVVTCVLGVFHLPGWLLGKVKSLVKKIRGKEVKRTLEEGREREGEKVRSSDGKTV